MFVMSSVLGTDKPDHCLIKHRSTAMSITF